MIFREGKWAAHLDDYCCKVQYALPYAHSLRSLSLASCPSWPQGPGQERKRATHVIAALGCARQGTVSQRPRAAPSQIHKSGRPNSRHSADGALAHLAVPKTTSAAFGHGHLRLAYQKSDQLPCARRGAGRKQPASKIYKQGVYVG